MSERFFHDEFACNLDNDYENSNDEDMIQNCKYRNELREVQKQEGNHQDAQHMYVRGWMQTINLAIGCIVLGIVLYRQK